MSLDEKLKQQISELSSTDFLTLIEEECSKRKVDRDKVKGGNDIEINKIYLLLTDQFWMIEIFVILHKGMYKGFKLKESEAKEEVNYFNLNNPWTTVYKREIVDLRNIY